MTTANCTHQNQLPERWQHRWQHLSAFGSGCLATATPATFATHLRAIPTADCSNCSERIPIAVNFDSPLQN